MKITDSQHRIAELIDFLGVNQTEFCQKTGLQKSALSNYLNGDREPRQDQISKITDAYNINPAWIMGYDVPMEWDEPETFDTPEEFEAHWNAIGGGRHPIELSNDEYTLVVNYRAASKEDKSAAMRILSYARKLEEAYESKKD